jgi:hypothetical protein
LGHLSKLGSPVVSNHKSSKPPRLPRKVGCLKFLQLSTLEAEHGITIHQVDFNGLVHQAIEDPSSLGLSNVLDMAFNRADNSVVASPDEYMYWDENHFTTTFYGILAGRAAAMLLGPINGDFDGNRVLGPEDIDTLSMAIRLNDSRLVFDLNDDAMVSQDDRDFWVHDLANTWFGDANLDGEFNSGDLVEVLAAGTYEVDVDAGWASGDFDGSGRFDSSDLVVALAEGGYEQGPRVVAVPEPSFFSMFVAGMVGIATRRRRHRDS